MFNIYKNEMNNLNFQIDFFNLVIIKLSENEVNEGLVF